MQSYAHLCSYRIRAQGTHKTPACTHKAEDWIGHSAWSCWLPTPLPPAKRRICFHIFVFSYIVIVQYLFKGWRGSVIYFCFENTGAVDPATWILPAQASHEEGWSEQPCQCPPSPPILSRNMAAGGSLAFLVTLHTQHHSIHILCIHSILQKDYSEGSGCTTGSIRQNWAPEELMPGALQLKCLLNQTHIIFIPSIYWGNNLQKTWSYYCRAVSHLIFINQLLYSILFM